MKPVSHQHNNIAIGGNGVHARSLNFFKSFLSVPELLVTIADF